MRSGFWNPNGQQTVVQTRDIPWSTPSQGTVLGARGGASSGPREKTLQMAFNVTNQQDEVVETSGQQRFQVKCELPRTPPSPKRTAATGSEDLQAQPARRVRPMGTGPVRPKR